MITCTNFELVTGLAREEDGKDVFLLRSVRLRPSTPRRMAHRCVRSFKLATPARFSDARRFHTSSPASDVLAIPFAGYSTAASASSSPGKKPIDVLRARKTDEIKSLLSAETPNPNRVWASYLELLEFYGNAKVPLDIHQSVLRKCAPPATNIRALASRHRASGVRYSEDQVYESRYQRVIRNIRSGGDAPALGDYHCVLELFAAVGNHAGAMLVLQEIGRVGLEKKPRTYGLVLQALSHRLALPVLLLDHPLLVREVTEQCKSVLKEMATLRVEYTPPNVDLAFRILKESLDMEGFKLLLRHAYGIDLEYPDRPPLEYWDKSRATATDESQDGPPLAPPTQLPFTIAAFNTTLDYLGRAGDVSKLVQMFEVATAPLPSNTSTSSFDDDDDDDFGVSNPQVAPYKPPHVRPNTTSFRLMLKWTARARNQVLVRHYLDFAIQTEQEQNRQLREWSLKLHPDEIPSPVMTVNQKLFIPARALGNRDKNLRLLSYVHAKTKRYVRMKKLDIAFYSAVRQGWIDAGVYHPVRNVESDLTEELEDDLPSVSPTSRFSTFFDRSSSAHPPGASGEPSKASPFAVDPNPARRIPPAQLKRFDIDVHLRTLSRDLEKLVVLEEETETILRRDAQRVKERLGRRVWAGKDVFLRHARRRTVVERGRWRESVRFHDQSEIETRRERAEREAKEAEARTAQARAERAQAVRETVATAQRRRSEEAADRETTS